MASRKRQPVLNFDGEQLLVWNVRPFKELYEAITVVRRVAVPSRPLGLITGQAGSGKTYTANVYAHNNPDTLVVTVPPRDVATPRMLLDTIAEAIDIDLPAHGSRRDTFNQLADGLADRKPYLIMDEADRLRPGNADVLRELAEVTGCPLCYLGCPSVENVLAYVPATYHRIGFRHQVRSCELDDVRTALTGAEMGEGRVLDDETIKCIWETTHGNMRHIESLLHLLRGARKRSTQQLYELKPETIKLLNARFQKAA